MDPRTLSWLLLVSAPVASAAGAEFSFLPAKQCALCHSGQHEPWRGSMMAHAAQDPFWKAKVRSEMALAPDSAAQIETKCRRCHAPAESLSRGEEGVTCTVCHQIVKDNLGARESFTGGFRFGSEKRIYGPHAEPFQMPMLHHTGYTATESKHVLDSALCGTCHTVILGDFIEQAPYLEWLASDYPAAGVTCQTCHVPPQPEPQFIAHNPMGWPFPPTRPRKPFGKHLFAGANSAMLEALDGPPARGRDLLASALTLDVVPEWQGGRLAIAVEARNQAGHKLPTGFPSRRIWLEVRVLDARDRTLWVSGDWDRGSAELRDAGRATVWEAAYLDAQDKPTQSLIRAARYGKDTRILPRGFDIGRSLPGGMTARQIGPVSTALDTGFLPGLHRIRYQPSLGKDQHPAKVTVTAWYQTIAPNFAAGLAGVPDAGRTPVRMTAREVSLSPIADK